MYLFVILLGFVGLAILLAWYLISRDRGEKEPAFVLWLAVVLGLAGAFVAGDLEARLISDSSLMPGVAHSTLFAATLAVGLIEEACKFLPLALFLYRKRYFNEHTDGVIYFALAGLGFGLPENILYTLQFGTEAGKLRLLLTPLFHAAATGVIGYFLIKRKLSHRPVWPVSIVLFGMAALHGLYNFGLIAGTDIYLMMSLVITLGLSVMLFMAYLRATQRDQEAGLSTSSVTLTRAREARDLKVAFGTLVGIFGIVGAMVMPIIGLVAGTLGLAVLAGVKSRRRVVSGFGLSVSVLALAVGLGGWTYNVKQTQVVHHVSANESQSRVVSKTFSTNCYSVDFIDRLNIVHEPDSCSLDAFNESSIDTSTSAYKINSVQANVPDNETFLTAAKNAINYDIGQNLDGFGIKDSRSGSFAGKPAYIVTLFNEAEKAYVVEAAVLRSTETGDNIFVITHVSNQPDISLQVLEAGWQWK